MYALQKLTERQVPPVLQAMIDDEILTLLDVPQVLKYPTLPYVIHQFKNVFEGDYFPEPEYKQLSFLPFLFFKKGFFDAYQTECLCFVLREECKKAELDTVIRRLSELDVHRFIDWSNLSKVKEVRESLYSMYYEFMTVDDIHIYDAPFYQMFAELTDEIVNTYCSHFESYLMNDLRLTYLDVDYENHDCSNSISYFTDSYASQLAQAKHESHAHSTYNDVYPGYAETYTRDMGDVVVHVRNPIRGGGFSCTL